MTFGPSERSPPVGGLAPVTTNEQPASHHLLAAEPNFSGCSAPSVQSEHPPPGHVDEVWTRVSLLWAPFLAVDQELGCSQPRPVALVRSVVRLDGKIKIRIKARKKKKKAKITQPTG